MPASIELAPAAQNALTQRQPITFFTDSQGNLYISINGGAPTQVPFNSQVPSLVPAFSGGTATSFLEADAGFKVKAQPATATVPDLALPNTVLLNPNEVSLLQGLINSLSAAGGGEIWLTAGTYALTAALTMPATGKITIRGLGKGAVRINGAAGADVFLWANASPNIYLHNLVIVASTGSAKCVNATGAVTNVVIEFCTMASLGTNDCIAVPNSGGGFRLAQCSLAPGSGGSGFNMNRSAGANGNLNFEIHHNTIVVSGGGVGICVKDSTSGNLFNIKIHDNEIQIVGANTEGILVSTVAGSGQVLWCCIANNSIDSDESQGQYGVDVNAANGVSITGNVGVNFSNRNGANCRLIRTQNTTTFGGGNGCAATGNVRCTNNGQTPNSNAFDGNTTVAGNT